MITRLVVVKTGSEYRAMIQMGIGNFQLPPSCHHLIFEIFEEDENVKEFINKLKDRAQKKARELNLPSIINLDLGADGI